MEEGDFGRPVFECSDSPAVFECIQAWLRQCDMEHDSCDASSLQDVLLPTRLLDVGGNHIRLLETTKHQRGKYLCLSHCWGGHQPIRTLRDNIEQHKQEIPWDHIPKTFQDAVTIARQTEHRYLWIDSLCIIQDSTSDWQAEAARMADIYSRAFFTITALSATNSTEGCFPIQEQKYKVHALAAVSFDNKQATVFVRQDHGHPGSQRMSQVTVLGRGAGQPLLDRAWVFQERNLSPRVVFFGKTEIFWECRTAGYCGCRPGIRRDPDRAVCIQTEPWRQWQWAVNAYSCLSLTMAKDTFPALSGFATAFQRENKGLGRYFAGHWEMQLPRCLAWTASEHRTVQAESHAPSWSWASVPSVYYDLRELEPACSVAAVECRQVGVDPYGELEAAGLSSWIELTGRLFPATLSWREEGGRKYLTYDLGVETPYGKGGIGSDVDFEATGSPDAIPPGGVLEVDFLHLGVGKDANPNMGEGDRDIFLVLRRLENRSEYRRIGTQSCNQRWGKIFPDDRLHSREKVTVRIK